MGDINRCKLDLGGREGTRREALKDKIEEQLRSNGIRIYKARTTNDKMIIGKVSRESYQGNQTEGTNGD